MIVASRSKDNEIKSIISSGMDTNIRFRVFCFLVLFKKKKKKKKKKK
jgi:hypothetical protein